MIRHAPRAFTLVEILAALAVLGVGLTAIVGLVLGSVRLSGTAADRNIAKVIIAEAVADIERIHLITTNMLGVSAPGISPDEIGLLIETVNSPNPNTHEMRYKTATVGSTFFDFQLSKYTQLKCFTPPLNAAATNTLLWPFSNGPRYEAGPVVAGGAGDETSFAYRVIYRLERHPNWHPHSDDCTTWQGEDSDSPFAGTYVLTLAVYRDLDRKGGRLEQTSDPMVMYLRDKKVRQ